MGQAYSYGRLVPQVECTKNGMHVTRTWAKHIAIGRAVPKVECTKNGKHVTRTGPSIYLRTIGASNCVHQKWYTCYPTIDEFIPPFRWLRPLLFRRERIIAGAEHSRAVGATRAGMAWLC